MKDSIAPGSTAKTDRLAFYLGAPQVSNEPHVNGRMAAYIVMPASPTVFCNPKT
jgi:hypothetical protein